MKTNNAARDSTYYYYNTSPPLLAVSIPSGWTPIARLLSSPLKLKGQAQTLELIAAQSAETV